MQKKKLASDIVWSVGALVLMNGVLQLFVYPFLSGRLGAEAMGNVLYVMGLVAIVAPAVGLAANNTRLIERRTCTPENGDFILSMLLQTIPLGAILLWISSPYLHGIVDYIAAVLLILLTTFRYYADVEYRMTLHYRGYFTYYAAISAGYLIGLGVYAVSGNWLFCFLLGEAAAFLVSAFQGHVLRPMTLSPYAKRMNHQVLILSASYLLYNGVLNLDRVLLQNLVDSTAVTVYYVASLLGKTVALLVGPLNGIMIGYLTRKTGNISRRQYGFACLLCIGAGAVCYLAIVLVTPVFVHILYPSIAEEVLSIASIANLSQIFCFSSSLLLTILLTFANQKWQLLIQSIYAILFFVAGTFSALNFSVAGFVWSGLAVNVIRFSMTAIIGMTLLKRKEI